MFGNLLAIAGAGRTGALLASLALTMVLAGPVNAAHLVVPVLLTPIEQAEFNKFMADRPVPTTDEERKRLFREFTSWRKARQ